MADNNTQQTVCDIVKRVGNIAELAPDQDFYDAGLTSLASLTLLLELEDAFGVSIADEQFINCRTVNDVTTMIQGLQS